MEKLKAKINAECLICKDEYCPKALRNKIYCAFFTTKKLGKNFIKAVGLLLIAIIVPIVINVAYMIGSDTPNTIFAGYHLLAYAGACIFGLAVYWQTRKNHKKNQELQERSLRLENHNLQYNTFVYLNVLMVETSADFTTVKTVPLNKAIAWPLNVKAAHYFHCFGEVPPELQQQLDKLPDLDYKALGYSEDYKADVVEKMAWIDFERTSLCIDIYSGVFMNASPSPQLVLWTGGLITPRYYEYYTPIYLRFCAKSTRENFFVSEIEVSSFRLTLRCEKGNSYVFDTRVEEPLIIKTMAMANSNKYSNCDHVFSVELHLCHSYAELLHISKYQSMDIEIDATYINTFGVRTKRKQGFRVNVGRVVTETVDSVVLDDSGLPIKKVVYKRKDSFVQHYLASDLSIENDDKDRLIL